MTLQDRIQTLVKLGEDLGNLQTAKWQSIVLEAAMQNRWFTEKNIVFALNGIRENMLQEAKLNDWLTPYAINENVEPKRVGLILAGNIPLVGFHDVLACYAIGHVAHIKLSDKDTILMKSLIDQILQINPKAVEYFKFVDRLNGIDAVIATGSNNSARYFESYFGHLPHIIRKNRNSIAIINVGDTMETIKALGKDVFMYFGLGCRNVSKLMVPRDFSLGLIMEGLHEFNEVNLHDKYKNNFDYNIAVNMLNKQEYLNNGSVMVYEDPALSSRIATLHYEFYEDEVDLEEKIKRNFDQIQCIVSSKEKSFVTTILPGEAQSPQLWDYADNVDTIDFLKALK